MGYLKDATGTFSIGLILLGVTALVGGLAGLMIKVSPELETAVPSDAAVAH